MNDLFSIDQIFEQIAPWLVGISWDLGTILSALLFLSFLILGFDWVKLMLVGRMENDRFNKAASFYYEEAENALQSRDLYSKGSIEWEESNLLYKKNLNRSADLQIKVRGYKR